MSHEVYPSQNNISTYLGSNSDWTLESQIASWLTIRGSSTSEQFVYSGLALSIGAGLSVDVASGVAVVDGRILKTTGSENIAGLTNATTNYVYLQATITSSCIASFALVSNTTGTRPSNAVLLGTAVTSGGAVTAVTSVDKKPATAGLETGSYTGDAAASRAISTSGTPRLVFILSKDHDKIAISGNAVGSGVIGFQVSSGTIATSSDINRRPEITATGFLVGDDTNALSINKSASTYSWWAWL